MSTLKLSHIPLLENSVTYPEWRHYISQVLIDEGHWGHVEGSADTYAIHPKVPQPAPLSVTSGAELTKKFKTWWKDDNRTLGIITRRLSRVTFDNLSIKETTMVRSVWEELKVKYAHVDIAAQFELKEQLMNVKLKDHTDLDNYLAQFRTGREHLLAMDVPFPESDMVHQIVHGLPFNGTWPNFKQLMIQLMQDHIDVERQSKAKGLVAAAPDSLLDRICQHITVECHRLQSDAASAKRSGPGSEYLGLANASDSLGAKSGDNRPIRKHDKNPLSVRCTMPGCKGVRSHDHDHCFAPGGGMEGQGPGKKSGKSESASVAADTGKAPAGEIVCAMIKDIPEEAALASFLGNDSSLLDSGATSHLVKVQDLFHTYSKDDARSVTTANLGTLTTHGGGTCVADVTFRGRTIHMWFTNCLHAPSAAVNLISVGRLVKAKIKCSFEDDGSVTLSQSGKPFADGSMLPNCLFKLHIEFISVSQLTLAVLPMEIPCAMFLKVKETIELWHLRFGHPSERTTCLLIKLIVRGQPLIDASFPTCEPCIMAKHVEHLHPITGVPQPALGPLDLVVANLCGPFPVVTPHGKLYFIVFRDTSIKVTDVQLLSHKTPDQMLLAFKTVKARWENKLGTHVKVL